MNNLQTSGTENEQKKMFNRYAERKICIEITNGNQEKEFRHICRRYGERIVTKDNTAYELDAEGNKIPLYPIFYGFSKVGALRTSWWGMDVDVIENAGYSRIGFKAFRNSMVRGNDDEK